MYKTRPVYLDSVYYQQLGYNKTAEDDLFGVEVELEGRKILTKKPEIMKWWTIHQDGSLRANKPGSEAYEYVFNKPLNLKEAKEAIKLLFGYLNNTPGTEVFESYRTSIHVHVNCLNETVRTICNFITLSIIFDELFVSQNGETRIGNNFCLRSRDAEGQVHDLIQTITQYGSLSNLNGQHRYSSTNFSSLNKFGTIEFRSLECTTDMARLMEWIEIVQGLKKAAREYADPRDIIAKFSRKGPLGFMIAHLGDHYAKYAAVPGAQNMLRDGMRVAQDFAYCTDWRLPTEGDNVPRPRSRGKAMFHDFEQIIYGNGQAPQWGAQPQPAAPQPMYQIDANGNLQVAQPAAQADFPAAPVEVDDDDIDIDDMFDDDAPEDMDDDF